MPTMDLWGTDEYPIVGAESVDSLPAEGGDAPQGGDSEHSERPASVQPPPDAEPAFVRVIDLGDGGGVQRFEADTAEELLDKLTDAQTHATRKIRALNARIKLGDPGNAAPPQAAAQPRHLTAEEAFAIGEQLKTDPSRAFEALMASQVGLTPQQMRAALDDAARFRTNSEEREHALAFIAAHPEFVRTQKNSERINRWLQLHGAQPTLDNFEKAFADLNESGLLESRTQEQTPRIAAEANAQRRPSQGALAPRNSARVAQPQGKGLPSDEEAQKMPLGELRARLVSHYVSA